MNTLEINILEVLKILAEEHDKICDEIDHILEKPKFEQDVNELHDLYIKEGTVYQIFQRFRNIIIAEKMEMEA